MRKFWLLIPILVALLMACSGDAVPTAVPDVVVTRIFITATPEPTPTATVTASPTPTATPTAPPIEIAGNPRAYTLFDPIPQSGAPCGWVDTFDFPLDPPDGAGAYGGGDFGVYRRRYEKYHAGEDWGLTSRNNFGKPVYSIGHGQVTYAQPLGWGADKGVVIIRHAFPDGRSLLSFYGHLDPPSVTIREGLCVQRGEVIGQIGNPRTPPHLHFEVREHLPYATGGGYWISDPTDAGWLPPSQTVSQSRLKVAPGVVWMKDDILVDTIPLGNLDTTTFLMLESNNLVAIDLFSGETLWSLVLAAQIRDAFWTPDQQMLYILDVHTGLLAFALSDFNENEELPEEWDPLWEQELPYASRMDLLPLAHGGVLVSQPGKLSAFSVAGDLLWEEDQESYPVAWALAADTLVLVTADEQNALMMANTEGLFVWDLDVSGIPLVAGEQIWLYAEEGLYHLNLADRSAKRVYDLPIALLRKTASLPQSNGDLVFLHTDIADKRLISINAGGEVQWEFSVRLEGDPQLFELGGQIYLIDKPSYSGRGSYKTVEIFAVDPNQKQLFRIFQEGSRGFNPRLSWVSDVSGKQLLIHIADIGIVLVNPETALERMGK